MDPSPDSAAHQLALHLTLVRREWDPSLLLLEQGVQATRGMAYDIFLMEQRLNASVAYAPQTEVVQEVAHKLRTMSLLQDRAAWPSPTVWNADADWEELESKAVAEFAASKSQKAMASRFFSNLTGDKTTLVASASYGAYDVTWQQKHPMSMQVFLQ